jgi:hypothetical protein
MSKKQLLAAAVAAALSTGVVTSGMIPAFAADAAPKGTEAAAKAQAKNEVAEKDFMKVSEDALMSMRNLNSARLAIFNGMPERAQTYVDAAVTRIGATVEDADKYALDTKAPKSEDSYVPFDASLTVLDTFEPSEKKAEHIAKANEHLHKGENKKALEALKLGEIDVAVATSLVPVKFAKEHIEDAAKLVREGKYYEANLALKAVDDSVVVETYAVDSVPKTKAKATEKEKG